MRLKQYRVRRKEFGGGSPVPSQPNIPINPQLKKLKKKVTDQVEYLKFVTYVNSNSHTRRAIDALRKKNLDPNKSWDDIKNPFA